MAPDVATWLHDDNKRRAFTCSSLQFPIAVERMLEAERKNIHLPLNPDKTYTVRITLLLGELFPLFYNALLEFNMTQLAGSATNQGLSGTSTTRATQASPPIITTA